MEIVNILYFPKQTQLRNKPKDVNKSSKVIKSSNTNKFSIVKTNSFLVYKKK